MPIKKPVVTPKVLLKAKDDAQQSKLVCGGGKPWDKGHWSNRK